MKYIIPNESNKSILSNLVNKVNNSEVLALIPDYYEYLNPKSVLSVYDRPCEVLVTSREAYNYLAGLDRAGIIHFGLRSYNYMHVYTMELLTLGKCKFFVLNENDENYVDRLKLFLKYNRSKESEYNLMTKKYYTCDDGIEGLKLLSENRLYGFDFESAGFPTDSDFVPVGIGISKEDLGIYIDFRYYSSEESRNKFMEEFKKWIGIHCKDLICYYASFEVNALRFMFNDFYPLRDCLAMIKCDNRSGSLKLNAQNYLHINSWDDDQDELMTSLDEVFASCKSWNEVLSKNEELSKLLPIAEEINSINQELTCYSYNQDKCTELNNKLDNLIYNNQGDFSRRDFEYNCHLARCINKVLTSNFDKNMYDKFVGYPFAVTPTSVTGLYCIYDAYYTLMTYLEINRRSNYA